MAIHFNYIKGLNGNVTHLKDETIENTLHKQDAIYTYIRWSQDCSINDGKISRHCDFLPTILGSMSKSLESASNDTTQCDFGRIITSNAIAQHIDQNLHITNYKQIKFCGEKLSEDKTEGDFTDSAISGDWTKRICAVMNWKKDQDGYQAFQITSYKDLVLGAGDTSNHGKITLSSSPGGKLTAIELNAETTNITGVVNILNNKTTINSSGITTIGNINVTGKIITSEEVDALFFNAKSDQRAKSHIQLFKSNALDIVNKLPIYEFHYRNNDAPSIGVLAQDAITFDEQFTDFSLVNNPDATGENGDYMTVKESKLVYILWKAVQEQQAQINYLQEQLNKIKESL